MFLLFLAEIDTCGIYGPIELVAISIKSKRIHVKISISVALKRPGMDTRLYS